MIDHTLLKTGATGTEIEQLCGETRQFGIAKGGAAVEDVALIRKIVGPSMGAKASGGIRTREDARALIASGANRLDTSASVHIVTEWKDPASSTYKGSHSS
jgi:deoxyribose-phosphate aldolase